MQLDKTQQVAVDLIAMMERLVLITGGPGRGKSFAIEHAIQRLYNQGVRPHEIALAAPTGKAAQRVTEQTKNIIDSEAKTIHRLLEFNPAMGWGRNKTSPLDQKVIICDEASMVDSPLLSRLMHACKPEASLVLVGDADQLPPVGAGNPFQDLILHSDKPVARLSINHRQAEGSLIAHNADLILSGRMPEFGTPGGHRLGGRLEDDMFHIPIIDKEAVTEAIFQVADQVKGEDLVILTPQNKNLLGSEDLNISMQEKYNPEKPGGYQLKLSPTFTLRENDPVIHCKNNYKLGVFNGEVGAVVSIDTSDKTILVQYPDKQITYDWANAHDLKLAYSITIHKSQGSEYRNVILVCHSTHSFMLDRSLVYTAITRAKHRLWVIGDGKGLARAVRNTKSRQRNTYLKDHYQRGVRV